MPIWICGEPRFISGLTSTTTCNDIIQALIDDEIHSNSNGKYRCLVTQNNIFMFLYICVCVGVREKIFIFSLFRSGALIYIYIDENEAC